MQLKHTYNILTINTVNNLAINIFCKKSFFVRHQQTLCVLNLYRQRKYYFSSSNKNYYFSSSGKVQPEKRHRHKTFYGEKFYYFHRKVVKSCETFAIIYKLLAGVSRVLRKAQ